MGYIRLQAEVVNGPVTVGGAPELANHLDSADWISGTALRGALAALWDRNKLGDNQFLDFFCRGSLRFHGLFPVPSGKDGSEAQDFLNRRRFPYRMPLAFFQCKHYPGSGSGGHGFFSAIRSNGSTHKKCPICEGPTEQVKAPSFYYNKPAIERTLPIELKKEMYLYHGTDRLTRRAQDEALYSYVSVSQNEHFVGWLSGPDANIDAWWDEFKQSHLVENDANGRLIVPLRPGRGKKRRGYLQVTMTKVINNESEGRPAAAFLPKPGEIQDNLLVVVLHTPLIFHDQLFRPKTTLLPHEVFGNLAETYGLSVCRDLEFSALTLVEGWSGVHGLPRPPEVALSPGSTFVFEMAQPPVNNNQKATLMQQLEQIQAQGLGERVLEGFGQILINPPFV